VARGKQGLVWRLDTTEGSWAVKVPFRPSSEEEVRSSTALHEAAHAAGVPTPQVRRTTEGSVFASIDGGQARVYEWVDLSPPDVGLDPAGVGAVVAAIHCVPRTDTAQDGLDPWSHEPVGADRWDQLVAQLMRAGAPFAGRLSYLRDGLVALEAWIEPPQVLAACHRDLWADNLLGMAEGGVCVIDWENSGPADPSQELGYVLFEFARSDPGRARDLVAAYRRAGGPAGRKSPGTLLDADRPAWAHHRGRRYRLAAAQRSLAGPCRLGGMDQRSARRAAHLRAARVPSAGGLKGAEGTMATAHLVPEEFNIRYFDAAEDWRLYAAKRRSTSLHQLR